MKSSMCDNILFLSINGYDLEELGYALPLVFCKNLFPNDKHAMKLL